MDSNKNNEDQATIPKNSEPRNSEDRLSGKDKPSGDLLSKAVVEAETPAKKKKALGLGVPGGLGAKKMTTLQTGLGARNPDKQKDEAKNTKGMSLVEAVASKSNLKHKAVSDKPLGLEPTRMSSRETLSPNDINKSGIKTALAGGGVLQPNGPLKAGGKDKIPAVVAEDAQKIDLIGLKDAGYITPDMPPNLMSEEFRLIKRSIINAAFGAREKTKVSISNRRSKSNIVLVTSSNPSEGKTFCAINLALSIATEQDITVLLIDADFSKPEILNRLNISGSKGLMDVVADKEQELGDCLVRTNIPNLVLLPAGRQHNLTTEMLASERMVDIIHEMASRYSDRLIIIDSPPVLASSAAAVLASYAGQSVFVIEAEKTTEPQIKESLKMISACEDIGLLLNKTKYNGSNKKFASYYGYGGR